MQQVLEGPGFSGNVTSSIIGLWCSVNVALLVNSSVENSIRSGEGGAVRHICPTSDSAADLEFLLLSLLQFLMIVVLLMRCVWCHNAVS